VTGPAERFDLAKVTVEGTEPLLADLPLQGTYEHPPLPDGEDAGEYVVPIGWDQTRAREDAMKGMFASTNNACKLRNRFTLEHLATSFGLEEAGA
jgi:hypothetical protein